eukprot:765286-Rhodomonas_salina.1
MTVVRVQLVARDRPLLHQQCWLPLHRRPPAPRRRPRVTARHSHGCADQGHPPAVAVERHRASSCAVRAVIRRRQQGHAPPVAVKRNPGLDRRRGSQCRLVSCPVAVARSVLRQ